MRDLPNNGRLTNDDKIMHDHLCELLSDRMNEADVCTASVGIWCALSVMRDKLNLALIELDAAKTRIKDLNEQCERGYQLGQDYNNLAKERDQLKAQLQDS